MFSLPSPAWCREAENLPNLMTLSAKFSKLIALPTNLFKFDYL